MGYWINEVFINIMIITSMRSSSINAFINCPMEYFLSYILSWPSVCNKAMVKGTIVHAVLELLGKVKLAHQNNESTCTTGMGISKLQVKDYMDTNRLIDKLICKLYYLHVNKYDSLIGKLRRLIK